MQLLSAPAKGLETAARGLELTTQGLQATTEGVEAVVEDPTLVREAGRSADIATTAAPVAAGIALDRRRSTSSAQRDRRARQLRSALVDLGPAFVKLGQTMSTRPDLLPSEYVDVLETLQDEVPPAPWEPTREVIEEELGPVEETFDEFDTEPLSGASLGQVYRAELDGEAVAVKVRRPDIEAQVYRDLRIIESTVPIGGAFLDDGRAYSLETLVDQYGETLREELDYEREAAIMERVRANLADDDRVRIPEVVDSHTTERVLTMEYVDGTKITDVDAIDELNVDRPKLAATMREIYLQMTLVDGVFHADPHPGNVAVREDGTLVFYDFGMAGDLEPELQAEIVEFFVAVGRGDVDEIIDALVELGTLNPEAAETGREELREVIELFVDRSRGGEFDAEKFEELVDELEEAFYELPFRLPPELALILRVTALADGVAHTLDPEHDFFAVVADFLADRGFVDPEAAERTVAAGPSFDD